MTHPTPVCRIIRPASTYDGQQGFSYFEGISAQSAGARALCMHLLTIPPGQYAHAHQHDSHETAIYVLTGSAEMWYGEALEQHMVIHAGEFLYIPAGVPHLPGNPGSEPCSAVLARTDPNEQESVVIRADLEAAFHARRTQA